MTEEIRILVVDDEPAMRLALRETLKNRFKVSEAPDGPTALQIAEREHPELILTDVKMPKMSGMELLERLKCLYSDGPNDSPPPIVIVMTAYATVEDAVAAMRAGAVDYLIKPFSAETLDQAIDRALALEHCPARGPRSRSATPVVRAMGSGQPPASDLDVLIADDPLMRRLLEFVDTIADSEATVFITGESGTGKEVLARYIHKKSRRRHGPMVAVNCAALPEGLLESELFGFEKGSFTGAIQSRPGRFQQAEGGTLLLDEISEMPLSLQPKLLRVLQDRVVQPIGGRKPINLDIRIIATSNRNMADVVAEGRFRQDLFYRLNVIHVEIPPLRSRPGDIPPLCEYFVQKHCLRNRRPPKTLAPDVIEYLMDQSWPGNVRELENFIERAVLLSRKDTITLDSLFLSNYQSPQSPSPGAAHPSAPPIPASGLTLQEMEKRLILKTLERTGGNRTRAASLLGISVRTIRNKLQEYGLQGYRQPLGTRQAVPLHR